MYGSMVTATCEWRGRDVSVRERAMECWYDMRSRGTRAGWSGCKEHDLDHVHSPRGARARAYQLEVLKWVWGVRRAAADWLEPLR